MNINDLPCLCLRTIFSKLETSDLYNINRVCHKWAFLQTSVCIKINTLYLFVGQKTDEGDFCYERNEFKIPYIEKIESKEIREKHNFPEFCDTEKLQFQWLNSSTVKKLLTLFPNIKQLKIFVNEKKDPSKFESTYSIISQLITLLKCWSPVLESLYFSFAPFNDEPILFTPLVTEINNLQCLKKFTFKSRNLTLDSIPNLTFTILEQLFEFHFDLWCFDEKEKFFLSHVNLIKQNPRLVKLSFGLMDCSELFSMDIISNQQVEFYQKFVSIPFLEFLCPDENMQKFCLTFFNVERLDILFHSHKELYRMSKLWKNMKNLVFLDMFANYPRHVEEEEEFLDDLNPKAVPNYSVRILNIYTSPHSHDQLHGIKWHRLFPNLEILHFNDHYLECSICRIPQRDDTDSDFTDSDEEKEYSETKRKEKQKYSKFRNLFRYDEHLSKRNECLKLCLQPWKECSKLRKVYIGNSKTPKLVDLDQLWN